MDGTDRWLSALGAQLDSLEAKPLELVVCGGSALQVLGLVDRVTRDVDILALMEHDPSGIPSLQDASTLPEVMIRASSLVARDFRLPHDWLNAGPTDLLRIPPAGMMARFISRRYGSRLTIHFISRYDQIHFKMYAAMNSCEERHLDDLRALGPSDSELHEAALWCLLQDASDIFPALMKDFLRKVGYGHVADGLEP